MDIVKCDYISCTYQNAGICRHPGIQIDKDGCCSQIMAKINHDPEWLTEAMRNLRQIKDYPFNYDVDRSFLAGLHVDYPGVDLAKKIIEMRDWLLDKQPTDKQPVGKQSAGQETKQRRPNYRLRLRHWCENEVKWSGKGGKGVAGHRQDACSPERKYIVAGEGIEKCEMCGTATIMKYFKAMEREYRVYVCQCRGE